MPRSQRIPAWILPDLMKAGFLIGLSEAGFAREGAACSTRSRRGWSGRPNASARTTPRFARSRPATGTAPAAPGKRCCSTPARRARAAMGAPARLLSRRRAQPAPARRARAARMGRGRPAASSRARRCIAFGLEESNLLCAGRRSRASRARSGSEGAVGGACGGARDGDAGPLRRGRALAQRWRPEWLDRQRLCGASRVAPGAVRARGARHARGARSARRAHGGGEDQIALERLDAARCCGGCNCSAPTSACAGTSSSPHGSRRPMRPATMRSTTCMR